MAWLEPSAARSTCMGGGSGAVTTGGSTAGSGGFTGFGGGALFLGAGVQSRFEIC